MTLGAENLTWLKGRAGAARLRSVSELLDQIVSAARASGRGGPSRSVVGTVDIGAGDPSLAHADAAIRALFDASLRRPMMVKETRARYRAARKTGRRG